MPSENKKQILTHAFSSISQCRQRVNLTQKQKYRRKLTASTFPKDCAMYTCERFNTYSHLSGLTLAVAGFALMLL